MAKQITTEQRIKLGKLRERAVELQGQIDKVVADAEKITGEHGVNEAYTFDFICNGFGTVDELLERLKVEVK